MPDWSALKRRAHKIHQELRNLRGAEASAFPSAAELLAAASAVTGFDCIPVPADDPLLAQAHAVLDRKKEAIWYAAELPAPRRALILAHEFAHYWLHPELERDACGETDAPEEFVSPAQAGQAAQIATGYSPTERREIEANLFALELLLPLPSVRHAFAVENLTAPQIAARVGISEACVLSQLAAALPLLGASLPADTPSECTIADGKMEEFSDSQPLTRLLRLDDSQRRAAQTAHGPVLVDAGPGTGKTRTLVARLCYLMEERRVPADNILALTFSNKAAEEMRTRLRDTVGDVADRVWIGTFHAFGYELLRKDGQRIGLPPAPQLLETADAVLLLQEHIDTLPLDHYLYTSQPALAFPDILRCISRAKDELQTPADYLASAQHLFRTTQDETGAKAIEAARIYAVYERLLAERGLLDFGDLLMRPVQLLDACPDVRERWQNQFPHILADEYQDINRASAEMLRRLVGGGQGFWAVGDLRQAIYRFRGASPANVREFERDFPGGQRLRLEVNYRTRESIVGLFATAAAQMEAAESAQAPAWAASRPDTDEPAITFAIAEDETAQADGLAAEIRRRETAGTTLPEQAILCRTNRKAGELAGQLEARGVPVQHLGSLFERGEVKDLLALLALTCEPHGASLVRVAQFAAYAIPAADVKAILQAACEAHAAFPAALSAFADTLPELSAAGRAGLRKLHRDLQPIAFRGDAWYRLSHYLFAGSDYLRPLVEQRSFAAQQQGLAIQRLLAFAQSVGHKLRDVPDADRTAAFLAYLRHLLSCGEERSVRVPESDIGQPAVRMMTAHSSKGLEFPVVYLPGLIRGQFPVRKQGSMAAPPPFLQADGLPMESEADTDESLFFVALSRARDHLVLSYPEQKNGKKTELSPYLAALLTTLQNTNAQRVAWARLTPETDISEADTSEMKSDSENGADGAARPTVTLSAVEQYQECPRQYYYQRVEQIRTHDDTPPTLIYHESIRETLAWLHEEQAAGQRPDAEVVRKQFAGVWKRAAPEEETGVLRLLHEQGASVVAAAAKNLAPAVVEAPTLELTAEFAAGFVRVRCDRAVSQPDGSLHIERHFKRELRKDDHLAPRLALMRRAAKQQNAARAVTIALVSLTTGETKDVPEKAGLEEKRLDKYAEALTGIRAAVYPAAPDDRRCPQCPFYFLCPA